MIIAFHKPYGVLSQFTAEHGSAYRTLAEFEFPPEVYPIGRLDADSEGLLFLSNERELTSTLLDPLHGHVRTYWVQVEGTPTPEALARLQGGVEIGGYHTRPCGAHILDPQPTVPPRNPPIRERKSIPTTWIELELTEGKNRQVRKMTAAVGFPTLRLMRVRMAGVDVEAVKEGTWVEISRASLKLSPFVPNEQ